MIKSISIIYPIYNEQKRLSKTIKDIKKFDKSNNLIKKEYILVNDGSTDKTLSIIKNNFKKLQIWMILTQQKKVYSRCFF